MLDVATSTVSSYALGAGPFYTTALIAPVPSSLMYHEPSRLIDGNLSTYFQNSALSLDNPFIVDLGAIPSDAPLFYLYDTNFLLLSVSTATASGGPYTFFT